ncbi:MAG: GNAT family N-acetyltransferase [Halobacteriovoraceae bacterium]|nr:GNAT family N-acetyltransferase [Halobacteriovoraceae bacterium]MBC98035.1 GNAT family N-acetyltransferase [Halobacteriovoraceae bacterium]|tara:strand:+ start:28882 stop:29385 length:504 start_codon:yes stop_codon:yes gene_type:complete
MNLVLPCLDYWESYKAVWADIDREGEVKGMNWDGISSAEEFFQVAKDMHEGINLGGLVPCSNFWMISDDKYVGRMSIRHELNDHLREFGGHIGYEVVASERRKGHASEGLRLALEFCKNELNLTDLLLTCSDENIASIKTIEKNGGKLLRKKPAGEDRISCYYQIQL